MTEIVRVPFRGEEILTVNHAGKPHIVLKPALDAIGLAYPPQFQKLQRKSWAVITQTVTTGADGKSYQMVTVDVRTFLMLLATVEERRVAEHVRPKLVAYQSEVADVIERYWTQGRVVNPRLDGEGFFEPNTWTWDETRAVLRQHFGIALSVNELTRLLRTRGVLKQNGTPTKRYETFFYFTGTAWNLHPHVIAQIAREIQDTAREIQDWRFLQMRLELEGVGQ